MKQTWVILAAAVLAAFLMSCISMTDREMTVEESTEFKVLGQVSDTMTFLRPFFIINKKRLKNRTYANLMKKAVRQYGGNVEIINITMNGSFSPVQIPFLVAPVSVIPLAINTGRTEGGRKSALIGGIVGGSLAALNAILYFEKVTATGTVVSFEKTTGNGRQNTTAPSVTQSGRKNTTRPATSTPPPAPASPYFTGAGGRGMRLGIIVPESQGLNADLAYLPAMVQGVLVSNFSKYSGISVLDRISLDRVIAETLDPTYADNLDIVRLGHVAQVGHMLTGKIIKTSTGYTLQLNVTDTTPNAVTTAAYSGTCTVAQLDDHTAIQKATRELLTQMGVELKDTAIAELDKAGPKETIAAQTTLARGITAQKQGNQTAALDYYTQATSLDPALPEAATRFSTLADSIQGSKLAEKFDWLRAFAQTGGKYIFEISADENIGEQTLAFSGKNNITLTLRGRGANRTLSNGFSVGSGVTLILDNNITLRRNVIVNSGGSLIMNNGAAITGSGVYVIGGAFTMNGGTISDRTVSSEATATRDSIARSYGGGVYVGGGGTFTMSGGKISGNKISASGYGGSYSYGGGVYVEGTFTMNGGEVSGNTTNNRGASYGGGVYVKGTFTMNDGKISGNSPNRNYVVYGGGVYVEGTFTMSGGEVSGNTGGGVYMKGGTFTMSGGKISGNTTNGGVYVEGTFIMSGGEVSGNTTNNRDGGGVYVNGTFTMRDGTISSNTGSGVFMSNSGTFTMSNGIISGNTGSGVFMSNSGTFTMNNGTISSNTGSGMFMSDSGTFTMRGGTISSNTARENGGGVYVSSYGTFTKTGGTITGYTGDTANGNVVKNDSGAVQNFKGHAVYAGDPSSLMKIKEKTAGPGDNMAYDGSKSPQTACGAWDN